MAIRGLKKLDYIRSLFFVFLLCCQNTSIAKPLADPRSIFLTINNVIKPSLLWGHVKKPYPTNAWYMNLVINRQDGTSSYPVNIFPYLAQISNSGIGLSYSAPFFYSDPAYPTIISTLFYSFDNQLTLGSQDSMSTRFVMGFGGMHIIMHWQNNRNQGITAPIMEGSPYLTLFFENSTPQLTTRFKWLSVNKQTKPGTLKPTNRYEIILELSSLQTQTWLLYTEKPITLTWNPTTNNDSLTATQPYTGWARLVLQKDSLSHLMNSSKILDNYSSTIPLGYTRKLSPHHQLLTYSLEWITQNNQPPLMLTLPHHRLSLSHPDVNSPGITYSGVKGEMSGLTQKKWDMNIPLPDIFFLEKKKLNTFQYNIIKQSLIMDAKQVLIDYFPDDGPYRTGKRLARIARLILFANRFGEHQLRDKMIHYVESILTKQMQGKMHWKLDYDSTWGGIIPSTDDYGSQHYNDHHYHYGYWVFTFAVIAKFDPAWLTTTIHSAHFSPQQWIEILIRDYANPRNDDPYFPMQRHQDDYVGHSWASGLSTSADGQNQESSSEAVNAYYAVALYGKAMHDSTLLSWGQFLTARELLSAKTYWHVAPDNPVYDAKFSKNNWVVGSLWSSKVDGTVKFIPNCKLQYRCGLEYAFGIQMLPLTAISKQLLDQSWLKQAYPTIKMIISNHYGKVTEAWKWILVKGVADVMTNDEKAWFFNMAVHSMPDDYDNGDSKTNTLYFLSQ